MSHPRSSRGRVSAAAPLVACLLSIALALPATADDDRTDRVLDDRWTISVGGYLTDFTTDASVGSGYIIGTMIRLEDDLGVPSDQDTFRLDGAHRFNERHSIGFGYWSLNRSGFAAIEEQIEFEGNLFDIGAEVESKFDTSWFRVDWRYNLIRAEHGEAGIIAGLSVYDFSAGLAGMATVDDGAGGMTVESVRAEEDLLAPVPTIGFFLTRTFRGNLVLGIGANLLDLEVSDVEGRVVDTALTFEWFFSEHVGVGVGLNTASIEIRDTSETPYIVEYRQSGILAHLSVAF